MRFYENVVFPPSCQGIIDVTKDPVNLDPTGQRDCTAQLNALIDRLLQLRIDGMAAVYKKLQDAPGDIVIGFENRKVNGVILGIFPEDSIQVPMIYFPNGTYLVSDTISYSHPNLKNFCLTETSGGYEMNSGIRFIGQSRDGVVIKLQDHCKGFEFGSDRPVVSFMRGERSNVAFSNFVENLTIDIGKGNAGAVGLLFFANNCGAVRNVSIRSSDENQIGSIGLSVLHEIVSGCYVNDVSVEGFNYGIRVCPARNYAVFENITLRNQKRYGMAIEQTITSIQNLQSDNTVTAVFVAGTAAHVVLVDAELNSTGGIYPAVRIDLGCVFLRNIHTKGYAVALNRFTGEFTMPDGTIDEYVTHETHSLFDDAKKTSLNLPVEDFPDEPWEQDFTQWASVNDYGAAGDGVTDDTDAICAAMNSGCAVVWFQPARYFISRPITIPRHVGHVHFMFSDFILSESFREQADVGVFQIMGESDRPLLIEKLYAFEKCYGKIRLICHASKRTLYLRDIMTQVCASYFNTVPGGKVFFENVACTLGNAKWRQLPAFHMVGQQAFAHALNPERSAHEIINDGGSFWLMGFKTEGDGPLIETYHGGYSEILGGTASIGTNGLNPIALNDNSNVSVVCSTNGYRSLHIFPIAVSEIRKKETHRLYKHELPCRMPPFYVIPLYTGYSGDPGSWQSSKQQGLEELY